MEEIKPKKYWLEYIAIVCVILLFGGELASSRYRTIQNNLHYMDSQVKIVQDKKMDISSQFIRSSETRFPQITNPYVKITIDDDRSSFMLHQQLDSIYDGRNWRLFR